MLSVKFITLSYLGSSSVCFSLEHKIYIHDWMHFCSLCMNLKSPLSWKSYQPSIHILIALVLYCQSMKLIIQFWARSFWSICFDAFPFLMGKKVLIIFVISVAAIKSITLFPNRVKNFLVIKSSEVFEVLSSDSVTYFAPNRLKELLYSSSANIKLPLGLPDFLKSFQSPKILPDVLW